MIDPTSMVRWWLTFIPSYGLIKHRNQGLTQKASCKGEGEGVCGGKVGSACGWNGEMSSPPPPCGCENCGSSVYSDDL